MESSFQRTLADDGGATIVVVGEVDFSNSGELADCVRAAVAEWSPPTVRIDLAAASFIDSSGLGALIEGFRAAGEVDAAFVVVNPSPSFRRVLDVTGLCDFFGLSTENETADQARATGA
ncbi:STAS domain-containing protein [Actinoplanes sp. NPDC000266]